MTRTFSLSRYHSTLTSPRIDDTPVIALAGSLNSTAASHTPAPETDTPQADVGQATTATEAQAVAPTLTIYPFAGDNILNGVEGETEQIIRGMTTGIAAGRVVNITVGDYAHATATVQADGSWSAAIHPSDMYYVFRYNGSGIVASVSNADGTNAYASSPLTVNYGWPSLTLHAFTGDDIVSGQEGQAAQRLSGSAGFVEPGQIVTVTLNEKTYTAQVGTDGNWYIDIPAADMATLPDGAEITATVSNARGQQAGDSATLTVNSSLPSLTLNAFATDNVLSDAEAFRSPALSGTTTGVEAGQTVTITLNGKTYTTLVAADGSFSAAIPAADLLRLYNGEAEISATATNQAGETTRDSQFFTAVYTTPRITVNPVTGDNYINGLEVGSVEISGSAPSIAPGSVINLTFGYASFSTQVEANGTWRIPIEGMFMHGLPDGQYTLTVDAPGSAPVSVEVGLYASPLNNFPMRIDTPFGDGVLTSAEAAQAQTLTGSTGITGAGQRIELSIGEWRYETTAAANGEWVVTVPAGALQEISGTTERISVVAYDFVGNYDYEDKRFEVAFGDANLTMKPVAGDNIINAAEAAAGIVLSGTANASAAGLTLTVTLNGVVHRTTITSNGSWSVPITTAELVSLPDGIVTATVALPGSAPVNIDVNVAIQASPAPVFDTPFGDSVLTAEEAATDQLLTGTTGVTGSGQSVVITLNGKTYAATVDDSGHWQAILPSSVLQALPEGGATLKVIATDAAGYSGSDTLTILVDQIIAPITIYPVTGDNLVNFDEALDGITLGGITDGLPTGTVLTLTLAGNTYTTTTGTDGSWTYDVSQHDVFNSWWQASPLTLTVTAPDGQSASTVIGNYIDNRADATFNQPFGDGILTLAEAATDQVLTGKTGMRGAGQTVVVTLESEPLGNGNVVSFSGSVDENGNWQVTLPSAALQALTGSWAYMLATVTDIAGNSGTAEQIPTLALTPPTLTLDPLTGDNQLNRDELLAGVTLTGQTNAPGANVIVTLNGSSYSALADGDGHWSIELSPEVLAELTSGSYTLTATVNDKHNNQEQINQVIVVEEMALPELTFNPFTGDDLLNSREQSLDQSLSGYAYNIDAGNIVTLTLKGKQYSAEVQQDERWSVQVPADDLALLTYGDVTITGNVTDAAGNVMASAEHLFVVDPSAGGISINPLAGGDNMLNAEEAAGGLVVSGTVDQVSARAGVTVILNGGHYHASLDFPEIGVDWTLTIPPEDLALLPDGPVTLKATTYDFLFNTISTITTLDVYLHNLPEPTVNTPFGDGVLTSDEVQQAQILTGSTGVNGAGQSVALTIADYPVSAVVDSDGHWQATVPVTTLQQLSNGDLALTVTATDAAGNISSTQTTFFADINAPTFQIDPISDDNILNADETANEIVISGHAPAGTIVVTVFDDPAYRYTGTVETNGRWQVTVPAGSFSSAANGTYTLVAELTAPDGTVTTASHDVTINQWPFTGSFSFDAFTGDGVLTYDERAQDQLFSGRFLSDENPEGGVRIRIQTFDLEGQPFYYTTTTDREGRWQVTLPSADLQRMGEGHLVVLAEATDGVDNRISGRDEFVGLPEESGFITLDPIAGDNIINAAEAAAGVVLSGQSSEAGGVVSVQLNGVTYEAGVDEEGNWQLALPNSSLAELEDGRYTLTLSQTGFNGQTTTVTESLLLDADPANRPVLRIHTISHDNVLNGAELQSDQIITGSSENVESGQTLSLKIGGVTYTTQVQPGGGWSLIVPAEDLAALGDGGETLRASVTDASGNRATASRNLTIKSDRDGLSIDPVTGDNLINAADAEGAITLTGHTDGVRHGATVRLTLNGEHYTAKVGKDGSWSAKVPAADVAALEEGSATLTACVKSACGQMLYAKAVLTVDTRAPELTLTAVTGDNLISLQEAQAGFALTGSAGIAAAGLLVLVVLNGVEYHATVQAGGDWTIAIPAGTLADQPAGDYPLTVSLTDTAGNLTSLASVVTLEAAPDADATETAALTVTSQTVAESADSTLTSALAVPDTATDTADGTYAIGGQTLTLTESGGEALGGSGNDTIVLHTLDFLHIDGGSGIDTLLLAGSDQHLDLTAFGLKIENIDIFDLGNGSNSLTLGLHEAETVRDTPEESLFIRGADGSQLTLAGDNTWETSGQREVGGLLFDVYHATGLESADLLVQQGILVQQG
ncbi:Ig-like domain-containing protein [Chimaeribacter arupi]|uniref:Ig-like domain-containing protein n=1 Tax=Chimaeribacter arupi TaxID=2060066 RepID=UPI0027120EAA|nr:Ig-like domain-containing protein [Chimaeribacter arupi]WKZ93493.1 Ig-like domain-containing protein [Chimaeribacter arupi]